MTVGAADGLVWDRNLKVFVAVVVLFTVVVFAVATIQWLRFEILNTIPIDLTIMEQEYPTMHHFGIPIHTQSMTAYMILIEFVWEFHSKIALCECC